MDDLAHGPARPYRYRGRRWPWLSRPLADGPGVQLVLRLTPPGVRPHRGGRELTRAELLPVAEYVLIASASSGRSPSTREVAEHFGMARNTAWQRLWRCVDHGMLQVVGQERTPRRFAV